MEDKQSRSESMSDDSSNENAKQSFNLLKKYMNVGKNPPNKLRRFFYLGTIENETIVKKTLKVKFGSFVVLKDLYRFSKVLKELNIQLKNCIFFLNDKLKTISIIEDLNRHFGFKAKKIIPINFSDIISEMRFKTLSQIITEAMHNNLIDKINIILDRREDLEFIEKNYDRTNHIETDKTENIEDNKKQTE